ncbi:hypothetical protein NL108_016064 [Boleophthalmus pectinirostris]|nr:hypothetical protein NL108_016064 [Boleophthalmus pectinirostris]
MALVRCMLGVAVLLFASVWAKCEDFGADLREENIPESLDQTILDVDPDTAHLKEDIQEEEVEGGGMRPKEEEDGEEVGEEEEEEKGKGKEEEKEPEEEEEDILSVSEQLERVNKDLDHDGDHLLEDGDIAVPMSRVQKRNAHLCVRKGCKWPRHPNGKVYVPYVIARHYSSSQLKKIRKVFRYFSKVSCIKFIPRRNQHDFLYIHSSNGCWSSIGRSGGLQKLSLKRNGCIFKGTIQHELLHALGFNHEHKRSDRDRYVRVNWKNIIKGKEHNFRKVQTLNQGTPYDYNSIMHYKKTAFSKNGRPTLEACNGYSKFGLAKKMSMWDKKRINKLYCS